jgi:hypothetical protein
VFCHDALYPHHDRDLRTFVTFPVAILQGIELHVWIVGPWGRIRELVIHGQQEGDASPVVARVLLHKMHVVAMAPQADAGDNGFAVEDSQVFLSEGWGSRLQRGRRTHDDEVHVARSVLRCTNSKKAENIRGGQGHPPLEIG